MAKLVDFTIATERTELGNVIQGYDHLTYPINGVQINVLWTAKHKQIRRVCARSQILLVTFWKVTWWNCLPGSAQSYSFGVSQYHHHHQHHHHHHFYCTVICSSRNVTTGHRCRGCYMLCLWNCTGLASGFDLLCNILPVILPLWA